MGQESTHILQLWALLNRRKWALLYGHPTLQILIWLKICGHKFRRLLIKGLATTLSSIKESWLKNGMLFPCNQYRICMLQFLIGFRKLWVVEGFHPIIDVYIFSFAAGCFAMTWLLDHFQIKFIVGHKDPS